MKIFEYDKNENIIKIKANGVITAKQFLELFQEIKNSDEYDKKPLKVMIYHTKKSRYSDEILKNKNIYKSAMSRLLDVYPSITKVDIVDNPLDTAKQIILDDEIDHTNYKTNLFCTSEAAIKWVKNPRFSGFSGMGKQMNKDKGVIFDGSFR